MVVFNRLPERSPVFTKRKLNRQWFWRFCPIISRRGPSPILTVRTRPITPPLTCVGINPSTSPLHEAHFGLFLVSVSISRPQNDLQIPAKHMMPRKAGLYLLIVMTILWCGLAVYQARQDARYRLLPHPATFLATLAGLIAIASTYGNGILEITVLWHLLGGALLIACGLGLWWLGAGMGDVATCGCFGLVFGLVPAVILIVLSYGLTAFGVGIIWLWRRKIPADIPLGITLWDLALPAWVLLILVAPRLGIVI